MNTITFITIVSLVVSLLLTVRALMISNEVNENENEEQILNSL
jgi:hypothetical protein